MIQTIVRLEVYTIVSGDEDTGYVYSDTPVVYDTFTNLTATLGIEKRKDSISFSIPNIRTVNSDGTNTFTYPANLDIDTKDLIKLYAYNTPMTGSLSDHLIMSAFVKSLSYDSTNGTGLFTFTCFNRAEVLLNSFMFAPYNDETQVPYMIVDSVNKIKNFNINDQVHAYKDYTGGATPGTKGAYDADGNSISGFTGYIRAYKAAAYKTDGSGELLDAFASGVPYDTDEDGNYLYHFQNIVYVESYKSYYSQLEELSNPDYTGDTTAGIYISYVDEDNNLHWEPKNFSSITDIYEYDHTSISIAKDNDEVVNAVITNCGTDPTEAGVLALSYNTSSMGLNGARWKYSAKTDIADEIRRKEIESGSRTLDDGTAVTGTNDPNYIDTDNYPSDYPWTIQTTGTDTYGSWSYTAGTTTVSSDTEYKDYFRRVSKQLGERSGTDIITYSGDPLWGGTWELERGTLSYTQGQLLRLVIPSLNFTETINKRLRIYTLVHNFNDSRWTTTLQIEEDPELKTVTA